MLNKKFNKIKKKCKTVLLKQNFRSVQIHLQILMIGRIILIIFITHYSCCKGNKLKTFQYYTFDLLFFFPKRRPLRVVSLQLTWRVFEVVLEKKFKNPEKIVVTAICWLFQYYLQSHRGFNLNSLLQLAT